MSQKSKQYSELLRSRSLKEVPFISYLKMVYRPYICPFNRILKEINKNKRIFDIGFGNGTLLTLCAEYLSPVKISGVEIDRDLLENANKILSSYNIDKNLELFDGSNIPHEISNYNVITLIDVIHHIPRNQQFSFLKNIIYKASSNTKIIIKDIDRENPLVFFNKIHDFLFSRQKTHERDLKELTEFFRKQKTVDLQIVETKTMFVYPHFLLVLKKK